jgi:ketosteroid isomerase-like protein
VTIDHRALFERLVPALNRRDPEHLDEFFTEDVVIEYPQSGEVIRGLQNMRDMYAHYPVGSHVDPTTVRAHGVDEMRVVAPLFTLVRVQGGGNTGSAAVRIRYPDGPSWWWVRMYELRDGRIARSTEYFAQEFDAPDWRGPWVERTGTTSAE